MPSTDIQPTAYEAFDAPYAVHDGVPLLARIYRPQGAGPHPAIVEVHGGAWTNGDRLANGSIAANLAARGIVVASIDFRQPPAAAYPTTLADINLAIRWVKQHGIEWGFDAARLGVFGTSSGGHMAILGAMRPHDRRYAALKLGGEPTTGEAAFAVACWPVIDPSARYLYARHAGRSELVASHDAFWGDAPAMDEGNPVRILMRKEPVATPPMLIVQGLLDQNVDYHDVDHFAALYAAAGGDIAVRKFPAQGHAFIRGQDDSADGRAALGAIADFIRTHGLPATAVDSGGAVAPASH